MIQTRYFFTSKIMTMAALMILAGCQSPSRRETAQAKPIPWLGEKIASSLDGSERHRYQFELSGDEYIEISALIEENAVTLVIRETGSKVLLESKVAEQQYPNILNFIGTKTGSYTLDVIPSPKISDKTHYELEIISCRTRTPEDRLLVSASQATDRANQFYATRNYQDAAVNFQEALKDWQGLKDIPMQAWSSRGLGLSLKRINRTEEALHFLDQAMYLFHSVDDPREQMRLLKYRGAIFKDLGQSQAALNSYFSGLAIAQDLGDRPWQANFLNDMGTVFYRQGVPESAIELSQRALLIWEGLGRKKEAAIAWLNLGTNYRWLDLIDDAAYAFNRAHDFFGELGDLDGKTKVMIQLGALETRKANFDKAADWYHQALGNLGFLEDPRVEASLWDQYGNFLLEIGRFEEAEWVYREAIVLWQPTSFSLFLAHSRTNLAQTLFFQKRYEAALVTLEPALEYYRRTENSFGQIHGFFLLAKILIDQGSPLEALSCVEEGFEFLETLREQARRRAFQMSLVQSRYDFYQLYIDLLLSLDQNDNQAAYVRTAFEVCEQIRARDFRMSLERHQSQSWDMAGPKLVQHANLLKSAINELGIQHLNETSQANYPEELAHIIRRFRVVRDHLGSLDDGNYTPEPLSLPQIQRELLDEDTQLLMYALGPERSMVWLVGPRSLEYHWLPPSAEIELLVREYHRLLSKGNRQSDQMKARVTGSKLAHHLLGPVLEKLKAKKLLVIKDHVLHYLPFGALPVNSQSNQTYLIERHEIVTIPSASTLAVLRKRLAQRTPPSGAVAIVADPVYSANDPRVRAFSENQPQSYAGNPSNPNPIKEEQTSEPSGFPRLLRSQTEAASILEMAGDRPTFQALNFKANPGHVKSAPLGAYQIVHFATHGIVHPHFPELSGLVLSLIDRQGKPVNGYLRTHEIRQMDLPVDLVVLSACNTGMGEAVRGEGLMNISRAFMDAGAARVCFSLWSVDDQGTSKLMARFYKGIFQEGLTPSAALRMAQFSMLKTTRWKSPYYWAGFVLQGEW